VRGYAFGGTILGADLDVSAVYIGPGRRGCDHRGSDLLISKGIKISYAQSIAVRVAGLDANEKPIAVASSGSVRGLVSAARR